MSYYNLTKLAEEQQQSSAIPAVGATALGAGLGAHSVLKDKPFDYLDFMKGLHDKTLKEDLERYGEHTVEPKLQRAMEQHKKYLEDQKEIHRQFNFWKTDAELAKDFAEQDKKNVQGLVEAEKKARERIIKNNALSTEHAIDAHRKKLETLAEDRRLLKNKLLTRSAIGAGIGLGTYGAYKAYQHFKNKNNNK